MAKVKTTAPPDQTIYVGVLVTHLEAIVAQLNVVIAAARQLKGQRLGPAIVGDPIAIDPGNILVDGRCQVASVRRTVRAYTPKDGGK
jgi:hypothetical protein